MTNIDCLFLGKEACKSAAAFYGSIGYIKESCRGQKSCYKAAQLGGNITSIKSSCKGEYSCYKAASAPDNEEKGGFINGIDNACLTDSSCYYAAYNGAEIGSGIKNCVCDSCAGVLDDVSLPDECGEQASSGSGKSSKSAKSANTAAETALESEGQVEWEDTLAGALEDFSMKVKVDEPRN